jgi:hypothetical protein
MHVNIDSTSMCYSNLFPKSGTEGILFSFKPQIDPLKSLKKQCLLYGSQSKFDPGGRTKSRSLKWSVFYKQSKRCHREKRFVNCKNTNSAIRGPVLTSKKHVFRNLKTRFSIKITKSSVLRPGRGSIPTEKKVFIKCAK